jgi:metallophosphoesterase superfamily enzyme
MKPAAATERFALADGVVALVPGLAFLPASRVLVCADAHLGYEDVVGGALPLWSTTEISETIAIAAQRHGASEIVFLGDVIHGSGMSEGAARTVIAALASLREYARVTFVAGNHEGRTRGVAILGETVEGCVRDGWTLVHGDRSLRVGTRAMIGHLHPSLHLGGGTSAPCFLGARDFIVVPALTPYSRGLDVLGADASAVLASWNVTGSDVHVVATTADRLYPFGALSALRATMNAPADRPMRAYKRRFLRSDGG